MFKNLNLGLKLSLYFGGIFLIIFVGMGIVNYILFDNTVTKMTEENMTNIRDTIYAVVTAGTETAIETHIASIADKNLDIVEYYYDEYQAGRMTEQEAKSILEDIILSQQIGETGYNYVLDISNYEVTGEIITNIHPAIQGQEVSRFDFVREAAEVKTGFFEYDWPSLEDETIKEPKSMAISYFEPWEWVIAVSSWRKEFIDIVETDIFSDNLLTIKVGESGYPYVIDSQGELIIHTNLEGVNYYDKTDEDDNYFVRDMIEKKTGKTRYLWKDPDGSVRWKIVYYRYYEELDWIAAIGIYEDEIYAPIVQQRNITIFIIGGGVLLILLITFLISRSITKPIKSAAQVVDDISKGKVGVEDVKSKTNDEIGKLIKALNYMKGFLIERNELMEKIAAGDISVDVNLASEDDKVGKALDYMVNSLNRIIHQINTSVEQMKTGSDQIAESSQVLSEGSSKQAASLEEITSSINEISSKVQQNVESARLTNDLSKEANDNAQDGFSEMTQLLEAMKDINKSATEIKDVVKVVDDIAFQINLLALNADIEAARVGKYGRGFAVVANNVRNLAQKSATSAKETNDMVEKVVNRIEKGSGLAESTSAKLYKIKESIDKVTGLAMEVADSSEEQANGIEQIGTGLGQIEEVVQSNSANAEENAASSEELASQAMSLKELISYFDTGTNGKVNSKTSVTPLIE